MKQKMTLAKAVALFLAFLLLQGDFSIYANRGQDAQFDAALREYRQGLFQAAAAKLESILNSEEAESPALTARAYLLLAGCCEKLGKIELAREYYRELKTMLDKELIRQLPAIPGLEEESLVGFQEAFAEEPFFRYKTPTPVSDVLQRNVIYASKKTRKEARKEKKRFPWLLAIVGVVVLAGMTVFLLTKKKDEASAFQEIDWVRIPAGEFQMGDNFNEGDSDERPVHTVYLDEYHISRYEITIAQFDCFCKETGREWPQPTDAINKLDWYERPAGNLSWGGASDFCNWLSQKTGKNIRLPTEAQWEKAARGTYQYRYPWGNSPPDCVKTSFSDCGESPGLPGPLRAVGTHKTGVSPYGIHDMAGHLREWCRDWYSPTYYAVSPKNNPAGPDSGTYRVIRGGGIASPAHELRCADRDFNRSNYFYKDLGFRVVME